MDLKEQIKRYFETVTDDQFLRDLREAGCTVVEGTRRARNRKKRAENLLRGDDSMGESVKRRERRYSMAQNAMLIASLVAASLLWWWAYARNLHLVPVLLGLCGLAILLLLGVAWLDARKWQQVRFAEEIMTLYHIRESLLRAASAALYYERTADAVQALQSVQDEIEALLVLIRVKEAEHTG